MDEGTRRRETSVTSAEAENSFGEVFARVSRGDRVFITHDGKRAAVVLSMAEYGALLGDEQVDLTALEQEFDEMFVRMQEPPHRAAVDALFRMGSEDVGEAFSEEAERKKRSDT